MPGTMAVVGASAHELSQRAVLDLKRRFTHSEAERCDELALALERSREDSASLRDLEKTLLSELTAASAARAETARAGADAHGAQSGIF